LAEETKKNGLVEEVKMNDSAEEMKRNGSVEETKTNGLTEEKRTKRNDQKTEDDWLRIDFEIELLQNHPNLTIEPKEEKIKWF
jgi:hypothetical protein